MATLRLSPTARRLERRLLRNLAATCERYQLLSAGDRVGIAISGGKDSTTLLMLLEQFCRSLPFSVTLRAIHLDQHQPGYDNQAFVDWLRIRQVDFEVISEDTYSVVKQHVDPESSYCSLCSRLRRGALYTALERAGFNKLALGHHRDDALETFLMNAFFSGRLQAMPAKYRTNCGRFDVIRPLIETSESLIKEYAEAVGFPIMPCNLCSSQPNQQRQQMKRLLADMEGRHPHVRSVMLNALQNVRPTHLLDHDLASAWAQRTKQIRPDAVPPVRAKRMEARVVERSARRLPVIS